MFQWEHSAILLTFTKLSFIIMIFVLSSLSGSFRQHNCTISTGLDSDVKEIFFFGILTCNSSLYTMDQLWFVECTSSFIENFIGPKKFN